MSSKIDGVPRELLEDFLNHRDNGDWYDGIWITHLDRLRALLAAPFVERQPVAFAWVVVSPDGKEFSELQSSEDAAKDLARDMDGDLHPDHTGERHEIKAVYTAPPELAELQADMAQKVILAVRDACELEPADSDDPECICIKASDLGLILSRHFEGIE